MGEFRERGAGALRQGWERMDERAADGRERVREAGVDQRGVGYGYGKNSSPPFWAANGCLLRVIWPTDPSLECNCARNLQRVPLKGRAAAEFMQIL